MSSVMIVTVDMVRQDCATSLEKHEIALDLWNQNTQRVGEFDEQFYLQALDRHAQMEALLQKGDSYQELVKLRNNINNGIAVLMQDLREREERAIERAFREQQHQRDRNRHGIAKELLARLRSMPDAPSDVLKGIQSVIDGSASKDEAEAALARAISLLLPGKKEGPGKAALGEAARELARRLKDETDQPLEVSWLGIAPPLPPRDERLARIDRRIAEIRTLGGEADAQPFMSRLEAAEAEENPAKRNLLLDSLVIELARAVNDLREQRQFAAEQQSAAAPVLPQGQAIRQKVLSGLAHLGYEVREDMETLWAEKGRIVLSKPGVPDYGLEVGGKASRLQFLPIATAAQRDKHRDRDIEAMWQEESVRLQAHLQSEGCQVQLEKACTPGEVPLKEISARADERSEKTRQTIHLSR